MTQTYFPFDAGAGANITEAQWQQMAQFFFGTGPIRQQLNEFLVYADSTGMQVKVKSGMAWIKGHFFKSDAEVVMPISSADPSNPRIDRVILRVDWTANTVTIAILQGIAAVTPVVPALTQNTAKWEISLAQVLVGTSVSTIAAGNITDERVFAGNDYNDDITYFPFIPLDANSSGDIFPNGIVVGSLPASAVNYPNSFGTLINFRTSNVRHSQLFFGTGNGASNTFAPYYRMWYNGTWTAWTQLENASKPFFYTRQSTVVAYNTANAIQQLPINSSNTTLLNGVTIGTNEIVFPTAGKYVVEGTLDYSGLNNLQSAELLIRLYQADGVTYSDDTHVVNGYTGLGGNTSPGGVPVSNRRVVDMPAGGKIQFFARCSEAPRNINQIWFRASKISG